MPNSAQPNINVFSRRRLICEMVPRNCEVRKGEKKLNVRQAVAEINKISGGEVLFLTDDLLPIRCRKLDNVI